MIDHLLLKECCDAHGVSGHETELRTLMRRELSSLGEISCDRIGNMLCVRGDQGPRVLLAAHMDEIGFLVQNMTEQGFLQLVPVGGWWTHTLPSQRMEIKTRSGEKILGVIGSKPPHFLPEGQRNSLMPVDALFLDVGAKNKAELEDWGISLGDPVAPYAPFTALKSSTRIMAKALDNRAGFAAMIQAMRILAKEPLVHTVIAGGTVQEEVGTRGAKTVAHSAHPDCVIVLEAPPADDTIGFNLSDSQARLGDGVQIRMFDPTAITNPALAALAQDVAKEAGIPFQVAVRRSGGTDAAALHLAEQGIPCIVLGVPTRFIHAHNGIMESSDLEALIDLTVALVRKLDAQTVGGLTQF